MSIQDGQTTYYTTREVAEQLGVSVDHASKLVRSGRLKPDRTGMGPARNAYGFIQETITAFQASRAQQKHAPQSKTAQEDQDAEIVKQEVIDRLGVDALSREYNPAVDWSVDYASPKSPGTPMLFLSDIHWGEVVNPEEIFNSNSFDRATARRRVQNVFEKAVTLLQVHFANPDFPGIVLILGGDMISGRLHDEHVATDEVAPLLQAMEVAQAVTDGIAFLAREFPRVTIYCVPGNHGRTTRKPWAKFYAHNNLDWLCYKMVEKHIKDIPELSEKVDIHAPNARDLTFQVANRRYRLTHGDQFRGGDGIIGPLGPIIRGDVRKRVTASLMPGSPEAYDTLLCGHFHQLLMLPRLIVNGSVKGYDEFAMSLNLPWEPPQQALWTVHPKHGHTWYLPVQCEEK